eukprot:3000277-Amphidinium_carterae.1
MVDLPAILEFYRSGVSDIAQVHPTAILSAAKQKRKQRQPMLQQPSKRGWLGQGECTKNLKRNDKSHSGTAPYAIRTTIT